MKALFFLFGAGLAAVRPYVCSSVGADGNCAICNNYLNYLNDGRGGCFLHLPYDAAFVSDKGHALQCLAGTRMGRLCTPRKTVDGCVKYRTDGSCGACAGGYYPREGSSCAPLTRLVEGCSVYGADGVCAKCAGGYVLRGLVCEVAISGCYIQTGPECQQCVAGTFRAPSPPAKATVFDRSFWTIVYRQNLVIGGRTRSQTKVYSASTCVRNSDPYCVRPLARTVCGQCSAAAYLVAGRCRLLGESQQVLNCLVHTKPAVCASCAAGYYLLNAAGATTCEPDPALAHQLGLPSAGQASQYSVPNCLYYSGRNACEECEAGFYLGSPTLCLSGSLPGCEAYDSATACRFCGAGMYLSQGVCVSSASTIPHCAAYALTVCTACDATSYLSGGACLPLLNAVLHCGRYDSTGACIACAPAYVLYNSGFCIAFADPDCAYVGPDMICLQCKSDHYFDYRVLGCVPLVAPAPFCKVYIFDGTAVTCVLCQAGYALSTGACTPQAAALPGCESYWAGGLCALCQKGYVFDPATLSCLNVSTPVTPNGCDYNITPTSCVYCRNGLHPGGSPSGTVCAAQTPITGCSAYTDMSTCSVCDATHYLTGATCAPIAGPPMPGCTRYSDATTCVECDGAGAPPYYLDGSGTCVAMTTTLPHCTYLDGPSTCALCDNGYSPDANGVCQPVAAAVPFCAEYAGATCVHCLAGYYALQGTCHPLDIIAGCTAYASPSVCAACDARSYVDSGVCAFLTTLLPGCAAYDANGACTACAAGSALTLSGAACLAHCELAGAAACLRCAPQHFPDGGQCSPVSEPIAGCAYYSATATCAQCKASFVLADNACAFVPEARNCARVTYTRACRLCLPRYALSGGACVAQGAVSATPIAGCHVASADGGHCEVCREDRYQLAFRDACIPLKEHLGEEESCVAAVPCGTCTAPKR